VAGISALLRLARILRLHGSDTMECLKKWYRFAGNDIDRPVPPRRFLNSDCLFGRRMDGNKACRAYMIAISAKT
jgi:hypothetical protein